MQQKVIGSQKYRQLANECRSLAQIGTNHTWKVGYLQLAKTYDTLADQAEAREKGGAPAPAGEDQVIPNTDITLD
jgi:hypothetical protein